MGDEFTPVFGLRAELVAAEKYVAAKGEGARLQTRGEAGGALVRVDAHAAEIRMEARRHEVLHWTRQWRARAKAVANLVDNIGLGDVWCARGGGPPRPRRSAGRNRGTSA